MAEEVRGCREEELGAVTALASRVFCGDGGDMGADYPRMFAPGNRRTTDRRQGHGAGGSRRGPPAGLLFGGETDGSRAIPQATGQIGPLLEHLCPISSLWQGYDYV